LILFFDQKSDKHEGLWNCEFWIEVML